MQSLQPERQRWETVAYTDNLDLPDDQDIEIIEDFLPKPEDLVLRKPESERVTLVLDKTTVDFFRQKASELDGSYQRMIRNLLREYALHHR